MWDVAAALAILTEAGAEVSTRVTAFARVVFHRKIPMLSRAIEAQALSGLRDAYRVHGEELKASFGEHGRAAAEAAAERKALERAAALALSSRPSSPRPLFDDEALKLVLAALFLLLAATAAAAAALAMQLRGLRAELRVLGAAALEAAEAARRASEEARKRG